MCCMFVLCIVVSFFVSVMCFVCVLKWCCCSGLCGFFVRLRWMKFMYGLLFVIVC